jgi:putative heme transporter
MKQGSAFRAFLRSRSGRLLQAALSVAIVLAIFLFAIPKLADYGQVWSQIREMTWLELATLAAVAAWNLVTYWFVMIAALPGSNVWHVMKVNLASASIANSLPGGGALGIGVTYGMFASYGFKKSQIGLSVLITGIWNNFVKLGMPIVALALLAIQGDASKTQMTSSLVGVGVLLCAIILFGLIFHSERLAFLVGSKLGASVSILRRLIGRAPVNTWGDAFARFRASTVTLLRRRWPWLTLATLVSHVSLYLVLLLALRHVGVSEDEVSWIHVLAAFSFVRLVTAIPITPGGVGVVELALPAALISAGGNRVQVLAAVLVYRALTWMVPIPLGAIAYLFWRKGSKRRRLRRDAEEAQLSASAGL